MKGAPQRRGRALRRALAVVAAFASTVFAGAEPIVVASKTFSESYVLGEIVAQLLAREGFAVERKLGLGGSKICYDALVAGDVDVYVEYTGTIAQAIKDIPEADDAALAAALAADGAQMLPTFGFNNTYALAVSASAAKARGLRRISDLAGHRDLRMALSHEVLERRDGWPGLQEAYGFNWTPDGIEHALAYQAIADGAIDLTDAYSTDGELGPLRPGGARRRPRLLSPLLRRAAGARGHGCAGEGGGRAHRRHLERRRDAQLERQGAER